MALVARAPPGVPHMGQIKLKQGTTLYLRSWATTSRTGPLTH